MELGGFLQLLRGERPTGRLVVLGVAAPERPSGVLVRRLIRALGEAGNPPVLLFADRGGPWFGHGSPFSLVGYRRAFTFRPANRVEALEEQAERLRRSGRFVVVASRDTQLPTLESLRKRADLVVRLATPQSPAAVPAIVERPGHTSVQFRAA